VHAKGNVGRPGVVSLLLQQMAAQPKYIQKKEVIRTGGVSSTTAT
jgi:hypothetical protein